MTRVTGIGCAFRIAAAALAVLAVSCGARPAPRPERPRLDGVLGELRQLRRLDLLPLYRSGSVVAQESSYDRTGGNNDGFQGTYSFIRKEGDSLVLADLEGPGVVNRIWTPTPTEKPIAFYFDGESTPRLRLPFIDLFSGTAEPFRKPVVGNEVGGYYSYVPIPYATSLKIVYEGDDVRFHQIQYRRYAPGTQVESFRLPLSADEAAELEQVAREWTELPRNLWASAPVETTTRQFTLNAGGTVELFATHDGGRVLGIEFERPLSAGPWDRDISLVAQWDDEAAPAIACPIGDFFGYAFGRPSARSLVLGTRGNTNYVYLPMPFDRAATLRLASAGAGAASGTVRVFSARVPRDPDAEGRFYAVRHRRVNPPEGEPYVFLSTEGRGHYVGTLLQAQGLESGMTQFFEGDDEATVDGELRLHGTGSEDYFNGGWYALLDRWDRAVSLPIHGSLAYDLPLARTGGYRFYLTDKIPFERQFRLTIEHGPEGNRVPVDYTSVAFFYGDRPPAGQAAAPAGANEPPAPPAVHVFYPQLMALSLGSRTIVSYADGRAFEMSAERAGLARIDVGAVEPGRYRVRLTYERGPKGTEFSLWRRQTQVSPWTDSYAAKVEPVALADMGEVELTDQIRTLTIRTREQDGRQSFRFSRLVLERLPDPPAGRDD